MQRIRIAVATVLVLVGVGACAESAMGPEVRAAGASYDGGLTLGSGHRNGSDSTSAGTTSTSTTEDPGAERGDLTLGSGN
jgi:hypothetical protein